MNTGSYLLNIPVLTQTSRDKIEYLGASLDYKFVPDQNLINLLETMKESFLKEMVIVPAKMPDLKQEKNIFIDFDKKFTSKKVEAQLA